MTRTLIKNLTLALAILADSAYASSNTIKVASGEWPPYSSEALPHGGLLPLIIQQSLALSGLSAQTTFMNWDSAYHKTLSKEFNISPGWLKTPDRESAMRFSHALSYIDLRFFHHRDRDFSWKDLDDIKGLRLGVVNGYSYGEKLDQLIARKEIKTVEFDSDLDALIGIAQKDADLYPTDSIVAQHLITKLPIEERNQIAFDEQSLTLSPIYVIEAKDASEHYLDKFNEGLEKLKQSGEYANILENLHIINKIGKLKFYTEDNSPINYMGEKGPEGIMVGAVNAILNHLHADKTLAKINVLPWARAYQTLEIKKNTVLFALTKTEQREKQFKWAGPIYRSNIILMGLQEKYPEKLATYQLLEKRVCAVKNDVAEQLWRLHNPKPEDLILVSHPSQCAKMLSLNRVDLWATGNDTAHWHIIRNKLDKTLFTEVAQLKESFRYIAFSKDIDDDVVNAFQHQINYLQLSGKLNEIVIEELKKAEEYANTFVEM